MTQIELEKFRTEIEIARDLGDPVKIKAAELAFTRRLQECQVHTGQRVKEHCEQIADIRSEIVSLRVDFKAEIATLREETKAEIATLRREVSEQQKATSAEIAALRKEVSGQQKATSAEIAALRKESEAGDAALRQDIGELKADFREMRSRLETSVRLLKWLLSFLSAGGAAALLKLFE